MTAVTADVSLFAPYNLGSIPLANRIVMAPMTRNRAIGNVPNALMAEYYAQRAGAGLIVTEGTSPSVNGLGYARIPGCFDPAQVAGWRAVTAAVHAKGGRIFLQLMHTGRIGHPANMPAGARIVAPSAIAAAGSPIWTDTQGMQPLPVPEAMSPGDIQATIAEFVHAATMAIEAGFDGVELHAANGYLIEQFLNPAANQRSDAYGGSAANRQRFALEVSRAVAAAIGGDRLGIRLSPYGVFNDMAAFADMDDFYGSLAGALDELGLAYVHIVDHSPMGAPPVPDSVKQRIRAAFKRTVILSGGYDVARATADLEAGKGELVAFGRPFIANPDLVARLRAGAELRAPQQETFYTPGPVGYTDYPVG
jgi:N-ethylmaleimide reductase